MEKIEKSVKTAGQAKPEIIRGGCVWKHGTTIFDPLSDNHIRCLPRESELSQPSVETDKDALIAELREFVVFTEHKLDQRLQGQYTNEAILGMLLKKARDLMLKLEKFNDK